MNFPDLSAKQRKIVKNSDGVIIVNAGPGTGKTKTLTSRVAYLINHQQIDPQNILTLTFTQRAALEMKERLSLMLGNNLPTITTFHGLAFQILTNLDQEIKIIPQEEQDILLKKIIKESKSKISHRKLSLAITRSKNNSGINELGQDIKKMLTVYNEQLAACKLLDFDDLLLRVHELLKSDNNLREEMQKLYQYVLIDEFQDTNDLQYQIIKLILKESPNFFVIGDPCQSIYHFRGGSPKIFDRLKEDFPKVSEEALQINYRSCQNIVYISNLLFPQVVNLRPVSKLSGKVQIVQTLNEYSEADWIVNFINQKIGGVDLLSASDQGQTTFDDFAIIYRTHHLVKVLEKRFEESGMPYQIIKEEELVQGDHIKLLSMHAAKGLEFKYVLICGFEEGLIPYIRDESNLEDLEEEKRLLYVAMTRAKSELYLLSAKKRQGNASRISRFEKLLQHSGLSQIEDEANIKILKKRQSLKLKKSQMNLF